MNDNSPEWLLSLRALVAAQPTPAFATQVAIGLQVDGADYCFDSSGREVNSQSVTAWLIGSSELFIQLSQELITPQQAFVEGRLHLKGDPEVLCGVSLLFERLPVV